MIAAALALAAAASTSSASEPFLAEIRIFYVPPPQTRSDQGSCTVARVNSAYKPGEKKIAGPFRSRAEALEAMQQIPECQTQK
jgi:hypothetical protein